MVGYSGTPLVQKLGLKQGMTLLVVSKPDGYETWLGALPDDFSIIEAPRKDIGTLEAVHLFATEAKVLGKHLADLRRKLAPAGFVWVSWPKKAAKVPTDITEDTIRAIALPMGFVDVKVCAVSEVWSGLKLVIRKSERGSA
jgi:hypothetical protein